MTEYSMMWQDSSDFVGMMTTTGKRENAQTSSDSGSESEAEHECIEAITRSYE